MQQLQDILDYPLFPIGDQQYLHVSQFIIAVAVLAVGLLAASVLARMVGRRLMRHHIDPGAAQTVQKLIYYVLLVVMLLTTLNMLHVPITSFAFLGGAIAIGVGFGAQNIINNFISGWILMLERPVRIGDMLDVDNHHGRLEAINARCARIRRNDGIHLLVPNSTLLENTVINWTLVDRKIRTVVNVGVAYGSPVRQVAELIRQAADENEHVLNDPDPVVVFDEFGDNALNFQVYFWAAVQSEMQLRIIRSELRFRIDELFREADIVIAFPQRDVHLDTLSPLQVQMVDKV